MKSKYGIIFLTLIAVIFVFSAQQLKAQQGDTLLVTWAQADGTVKTDALRDAIANDLDRPAGRVYKLQRGGFYWLTETITNNGWALRIVGEPPGPTLYDNPAVLQMVARTDGTVNGRMITGGGDITLKNLYIVGADNNGVQTYYQPIQIDASNSRFIFDNIILERTNFALIAFTAKNNDIFFTNCKFRNLIGQPSTQQWEGRGISIWADQDSVVVENCTFFNVGMTALQIEGGAANYVRFNHNTLVNVGRSVNTGNWWKYAYFANNLIINGFWHGEGFGDYDLVRNPGRDPRATTSGMFSIGALPSKYGTEEARRVVFANVASWRDPAFALYYADSIRAQPFVGPVTKLDFLAKYEHMVVKDTTWLATMPDIQTYPYDIIANMYRNIKDLRAGVTPATPYFWKLETDPTTPSWPLPENFTYTTPSLLTAGTNSMPLGDLNWFPAKKTAWQLIKAKDISDIENMAGSVVVLNTVEKQEAEVGTVSGTAAVKVASGFAYYRLSNGYVEWTFDLATEGQYDLNVWTHLNNRTNGVNFFVNDFEIHDTRGWGQYVFGVDASSVHLDFPPNAWGWWLVKESELKESASLPLHLKAGSNKVQIKASWCDNMYAGFNVLQPGTTTIVKSLRASDVTASDIASLVLEGAKWTPSGLKSVDLGTNGTIEWNVTAPDAGKYRLQVFYQNGGSAKTMQIKVGGSTVISDFSLDGKADSTGLVKLSNTFTLVKGTNKVALTGSGVNVDYIQLIQDLTTSVKKLDEIPTGFALQQNYPNPFNPSTTIRYQIPKESKVTLKIFDILGREVATLVNMQQGVGSYEVNFNAMKFASGVYIYRISAGDFMQTKKMMLLK
ncbi:MAG: T9SS type A sorting domain-containing protein [Ignavibacteriales bacterium]|nr:T9SS type A sorting domain-containing protein [Ignavibacteriales bacterium]